MLFKPLYSMKWNSTSDLPSKRLKLISITGTSVNPARSIAPALFQGGEALSQLWLFIIAPFVGAALSAVVWNYLGDKEEKK